MVDEKPNNVVIHIGWNDVKKFNYNNVDVEELAHSIINIGLKCRSYGVSNITVSLIVKRNSFNINQVISQVNNILKLLCYDCWNIAKVWIFIACFLFMLYTFLFLLYILNFVIHFYFTLIDFKFVWSRFYFHYMYKIVIK